MYRDMCRYKLKLTALHTLQIVTSLSIPCFIDIEYHFWKVFDEDSREVPLGGRWRHLQHGLSSNGCIWIYECNPMSVKLPICISDNKVWRPSFSACYTMAPSLTWSVKQLTGYFLLFYFTLESFSHLLLTFLSAPRSEL